MGLIVRVERYIGPKFERIMYKGNIDEDSLPCVVYLCKRCGENHQIVQCRQCGRHAGFKRDSVKQFSCNFCDWRNTKYTWECRDCKSKISEAWFLILNKGDALVEQEEKVSPDSGAGCAIAIIASVISLGAAILGGVFFLP